MGRKELLPGIYAAWDPCLKRLEAFNPGSDDSLISNTKLAETLELMVKLGTDFLSGEKFERLWKNYSRICKWGLALSADTPEFSYSFKLMVAVLNCLKTYSDLIYI